MGPNNIVLRPEFAEFQFPFIQMQGSAGAVPIALLLDLSQHTLIPVIPANALLELPEVEPAKYVTMTLFAKWAAEVDNTITSAPTAIPAKSLRNAFSYTIDGVAHVSSLDDNILIEKGSVRKINLTQVVTQLVFNIVNFTSTTVFVPDASGVPDVFLSPVIKLWY